MTPSKLLLGLEGIRAAWEYGLGLALREPLKHIIPEGDGHPVMIIPGLAGSDGSTAYIRSFVDAIGYKSHSWGLGRNLGPRNGMDSMLGDLAERLDAIYSESGGREISIIGWSLGGIYARELSKILPGKVRQVITLGTPFNGAAKSTNAARLYEILCQDTSHKDPNIIQQIKAPPPVPFTSIYSKTDGVVHWTASIEDEGPSAENVEITGASHLGLGHNPVSMYVIGNRLSQSKESWQHYKK